MDKAIQKDNLKKKIVSFFGFFGYISCLFQWLWVAVLYSSLLKVVSVDLVPDNKVSKVVPQFDSPEPNVFIMFIGLILMIAAIVLVVYSFFKMPMNVNKTSKTVVKQTVNFVAPVISKVQHQPNDEKFRFSITPKIIIFIKLFLVILALILSIASKLLTEHFVDYNIAIIISVSLFVLSIIFFGIQYLLVYLLKIKL